MNFLQLCNRLIEKCGISGGDLPSVVNKTGESRRVVNWINEAYLNIQEIRPNWLWMENDFSFNTTTGKGAYTPAECGITDFGMWLEESMRCYATSVGVGSEVFLGRMDYDRFRDTYLFNNIRNTTGQPIAIAVGPDKSLNLGLSPGPVGYTIVGKYFRSPSELVNDSDTPLLPERFHMLVVYEAMKSYAMYEAASDVMAEAQRQFSRMRRKMENDQLPRISMGTLA